MGKKCKRGVLYLSPLHAFQQCSVAQEAIKKGWGCVCAGRGGAVEGERKKSSDLRVRSHAEEFQFADATVAYFRDVGNSDYVLSSNFYFSFIFRLFSRSLDIFFFFLLFFVEISTNFTAKKVSWFYINCSNSTKFRHLMFKISIIFFKNLTLPISGIRRKFVVLYRNYFWKIWIILYIKISTTCSELPHHFMSNFLHIRFPKIRLLYVRVSTFWKYTKNIE